MSLVAFAISQLANPASGPVAPEGSPKLVKSLAPFAQPFHLKLSLAIAGLAEAPVAADYPQEMRVDWVRVTQFK